jgi:hypothetical protein
VADDDAKDTEDQQGGSEGDDSAASMAQQKEEERDKAKEKMKELEENPPEKLEDWPDDAAKFETFGGPDGDKSYDEAVTSKLGPSSLRHHEDGSVTIEGEKVDNPEDYKGEPIPGGPTDPDAPQDSTTRRVRGDQSDADEKSDGDKGDDSDSSGDEQEAEKQSS